MMMMVMMMPTTTATPTARRRRPREPLLLLTTPAPIVIIIIRIKTVYSIARTRVSTGAIILTKIIGTLNDPQISLLTTVPIWALPGRDTASSGDEGGRGEYEHRFHHDDGF